MSIFEQFQQQAVDRLLSLPFFATPRTGLPDGIPVLPVHIKEIDSMIDIAVEQVGGLCILVGVLEAKVDAGCAGIPMFDTTWLVQTTDNPTLNESGVNGIEATENVILGLHGWAVDGFSGQTYLAPNSFNLLPTPEDKNRVHEARFKTHIAISQDPLPMVEPPVIVNDAGTVTITCATAGAPIFYTVDRSHPNPRNGILYTAPFSASGVTVKARAWLPGYQTSTQVSLST